MGKKKWIDKKTATNFNLVYRPQNDPLIHDESASTMVFAKVAAPNARKVKTTHDLEAELGDTVTTRVRHNEGEAAMYGVYYDDTEYDYMQHLRDMGAGGGESVFLEAAQPKEKGKGKGKMKLEDALRETPAPSEEELLPKDVLPSKNLVKKSYQDQQDIPDALAGFQPDMDPRLREVLEALEDEAYVDDDEDVFGQLTKDGAVDEDEFYEENGDGFYDDFDDDEEGWQSDATEKPSKPDKPNGTAAAAASNNSKPGESAAAKLDAAEDDDGNADWMAEYSKFKKANKAAKGKADDSSTFDGNSLMSFGAASDFSLSGNRRKSRKKRLASGRTESTGYSMTSSSLARTEGQTLLDSRFDRIEEEYAEDDDDDDFDDAASQASRAQEGFRETRQDFDQVLDDFLGSYCVGAGKSRRVKRGKQMTGLEQLDEIRQGLGKARIR